jgi:hypothetical protein
MWSKCDDTERRTERHEETRLPDAGTRFMSLTVFNEDHYTPESESCRS